MLSNRRLIFLFCGLSIAVGCAHSNIPGTQVADTAENREIMSVLYEMREAFESRDETKLIGLVSQNYFEDMGTSDSADDYGYSHLTGHVIPDSLKIASEVHLTLRVHNIVIAENRAYADVRYSSRSKLDLPSGSIWDSHKEFNRIELAREPSGWMIVSGL